MMVHDAESGKAATFLPLVEDLAAFVRQAAHHGTTADAVERGIFTRLLALGKAALGQFFVLQGAGDMGETLTTPDGQTVHRLPQPHPRNYRTVFGDFRLERTVYGSREGQAIAFVPLDARVHLPASDYSYLLQQWDQTLGCEVAFGKVAATLHDVLGLRQAVDSLERQNRQVAEQVAPFRAQRPRPDPTTEGAVFVVQADGKGVVIRRPADAAPIHGHRTKGQKAKQKRIAVVGTLYSIAPNPRTPAAVVASLFREPQTPAPARPGRAHPCHKHVWASLACQREGQAVSGMAPVFEWLRAELAHRNPNQAGVTVNLMDGQETLWEARRQYLPATNTVDVLDLLHVTPRLWAAAHLFCREGTAEATAFVRARLEAVLEGRVGYVVGGLRQMATKRHLSTAKRKRLATLCGYLTKNTARMRYDEYLAKGYPIASGVVEGACRHYVKDRMERAGMHWTMAGAQAMLDVRSEYLNGDWDGFHRYRMAQETQRLYPHRAILEGVTWPMRA